MQDRAQAVVPAEMMLSMMKWSLPDNFGSDPDSPLSSWRGPGAIKLFQSDIVVVDWYMHWIDIQRVLAPMRAECTPVAASR